MMALDITASNVVHMFITAWRGNSIEVNSLNVRLVSIRQWILSSLSGKFLSKATSKHRVSSKNSTKQHSNSSLALRICSILLKYEHLSQELLL